MAAWCQFHQYFASSFFIACFCAAFMCLQFGFVIFWQKDFGAKAAHKMLVKLTPVHCMEADMQCPNTLLATIVIYDRKMFAAFDLQKLFMIHILLSTREW